ncbi:hypothetical protein F4780DRAFT_448653 [Xylariomycetidae sp. FL0641]|nr:hypothetical protein F4780DRAFT_448653 [Xylariomycetidae sp. FL0641]
MEMLAPAEAVAPSTAATTLYFDPLCDRLPLMKPHQPSFKKHKTLPHPRNNRPVSTPVGVDRPSSGRLSVGTTATSRLPRNTRPVTPPHQSKGDRTPKPLGPSLPPTPPAHSRTSSSSQSIVPAPSTPTYVDSPERSVASESVQSNPGTPPSQKSPPTPDVTPPKTQRRPKAHRPYPSDRFPSKGTADSRAESFKTAREDPDTSDEENKSTPQPALVSARTSQSTVKRVADGRTRKVQDIGLGLGLESDDNLTPRTKQEFITFDGEWASASEVEQEWDDNLQRNVIVRKRRDQPAGMDGRKAEVVEDVTITPTNATKALRSMPLHERLNARSTASPQEFASRGLRWSVPSASESSTNTDVKRFSGMSSRSTVSTVVEAILVDSPTPSRQKTLRHVRKQTGLRDSSSEISAPSSTTTSVRPKGKLRRARASSGKQEGPRPDSMASSGTANSVSSRKARREVWKSGGIPVVVIPDRRTSANSSSPPSLRSTSSHRSKRSNSLGSVPISYPPKVGDTPPQRRGRSRSESDGSVHGSVPDQLTMDYPPIVPIRRSSLSAPTSRNTSRAGSRAGSLTAESLEAHNAIIEQEHKQDSEGKQELDKQEMKQQPPQVTVKRVPPVEDMSNSGQKHLQAAPSVESHRDESSNHKALVDHNGDPFFGKRLTAYNTPFSQASVETNGTHSVADIAEAMAVNIYPHQNKSVLMVDHMSKPADSTNALQRGHSTLPSPQEEALAPERPQITASGPDGGPVTPPQAPFSSMDNVDYSPLRNPRAPPEPPAIQFIPATPSGSTPAAEKDKMLGNYFQETSRQPSLVRRAFSLRKDPDGTTSRPGFIARTLSLSRAIRRDTAANPALGRKKGATFPLYPTGDDPPTDDSRLHPFWRPASHFDLTDDEDLVYEENDRDMDRGRPRMRRSLSLTERMKRTFAILPIDDDAHYTTEHPHRGPERRTIRRTPSGSLRVMRHQHQQRDSSLARRWSFLSRTPSRSRPSTSSGGFGGSGDGEVGRPSTAPTWPGGPPPGRVEKQYDARGRRLFPSWQDKLGALAQKPADLQRRLSEKRRQKRSDALRRTISGPREVRDGVGDVIKRRSYLGPSYQTASRILTPPPPPPRGGARSSGRRGGRYSGEEEARM